MPDSIIQNVIKTLWSIMFQPKAISALERKCNPINNEKKPNKTFTWFSHVIDFEMKLIIWGKINGIANPKEKPNIPIIGPASPPFPAKTNTKPAIGPVEATVIIGNESAIKNTCLKFSTPPRASIFFVHLKTATMAYRPQKTILH